MATTISITIDDFGKIVLPLEVNEQLNFKNDDYLKVSIKSNQIVLAPLKFWFDEELDEEMLNTLIHEGILVDIEQLVEIIKF